ncbi:MAG TPA: VOC family protein, partial [Actinomycetota bacterium]|nr:VOC family protein [Actinomycetota bacterium]
DSSPGAISLPAPSRAGNLSTMGTTLPPGTRMGSVELAAADFAGMRGFYENVIGLEVVDTSDDGVSLGTGGSGLVRLLDRAGAPRKPYGTTGLFHLALLVPDRPALAQAVRRVVDNGWRFTGASDHLVSEALYLDDPEGNGIEIYRDRPREEWSRRAGEIEMATLPLDLDAVMEELPKREVPARIAAGTTMGHVHLQVADLAETEAFYVDGLGFEVTVRGYPGALFVSAGGYHHHLGLNTWAGEGAPPPPPGYTGLRRYEVVVPSSDVFEEVKVRLDGSAAELTDEGLVATDPSGNEVLLRA